MARPSKLSQEQCERIRMLRDEGVSPPQLAKRFKVSESSMYKILNGTYVAAPSSGAALPPAVQPENMGSTPSLFRKAEADEQVTTRVIKAAESQRQPVDEVTLAAAELIVAQARYAQLRKHTG
jgi:hypothetical protein